MKKNDLITPFMLRQLHHFPGDRGAATVRCLVKVLGLHRMTVARIRERIKWFEGEHCSPAIVDGYLVRAIVMDKRNQAQAAR